MEVCELFVRNFQAELIQLKIKVEMGSGYSGCCMEAKEQEKEKTMVVPLTAIIKETDMKILMKYLRQQGDSFGYDQVSDALTGDTFLHELMRRDDLNTEVYEHLIFLRNIDWTIKNKEEKTPIDLIPDQAKRQTMALRIWAESQPSNRVQVKHGDDPLASSQEDPNELYDEMKVYESGTATPSAITLAKKKPAPLKLKKPPTFGKPEDSLQIAMTPNLKQHSPLILKKVDSVLEPVNSEEKEDPSFHKMQNKILISSFKELNHLSISNKMSMTDWDNQLLLLETARQ